MNYKAVSEKANEIIEAYDVRTQGEHELARALSGGNQQKLIIGREVERNPDLLIAALPTRGLDVGAIEFIHKRLIEQRDNGKAVLLISFELDEVMNVSDRIAVIYDGQIVDTVIPTETTEQELGLLNGWTFRKDEMIIVGDEVMLKEGDDPMSNRAINLLVPVISIILGLIVGAIVMIFSGYDPIQGISHCGMVFLEMLIQSGKRLDK